MLSILKITFALFAITFLSCNTRSHKSEQKFESFFLWKAEKIIPTSFGYNLIEIKEDTSNIESRTYLYLLDSSNKYIDHIILYGAIQKAEANKIEISKDLSGRIGSESIGNLKIVYVDLKNNNKSSGIDGSFLVDSLKYNRNKKTVTLFAKRPKEQFAVLLNEIEREKRTNLQLLKSLLSQLIILILSHVMVKCFE